MQSKPIPYSKQGFLIASIVYCRADTSRRKRTTKTFDKLVSSRSGTCATRCVHQNVDATMKTIGTPTCSQQTPGGMPGQRDETAARAEPRAAASVPAVRDCRGRFIRGRRRSGAKTKPRSGRRSFNWSSSRRAAGAAGAGQSSHRSSFGRRALEWPSACITRGPRRLDAANVHGDAPRDCYLLTHVFITPESTPFDDCCEWSTLWARVSPQRSRSPQSAQLRGGARAGARARSFAQRYCDDISPPLQMSGRFSRRESEHAFPPLADLVVINQAFL